MRDSELNSAAYSDGVATAKSADKLTRYGLRRELLRWACEAACIDPVTLEPTGQYHRDSESVRAFVDKLEQNRAALSNITSIPNTEYLTKNPLRTLGAILHGMGIHTSSSMVSMAGKRVRIYTAALDTERMPELLERLHERQRVVAARVEKWQSKQQASAHTFEGAHTPALLYRYSTPVNTVQDGDSTKVHTPPEDSPEDPQPRRVKLPTPPAAPLGWQYTHTLILPNGAQRHVWSEA